MMQVERWLMLCLAFGCSAGNAHQLAAAESLSNDSETEPQTELIVLVGAAGEPTYGERFQSWGEQLCESGNAASMDVTSIGLETMSESTASPPETKSTQTDDTTQTDRDRLQHCLNEIDPSAEAAVWIVLIGHGTFYDGEAKFNLRGPDLTATQLDHWLSGFKRPVVVVNTSSASGPFIDALSAPGRIIITATKSGTQNNVTRIAEYWIQSIQDTQADLDHDDEVSVLESFRYATAKTREAFDNDDQILSEHALIDADGDGKGTRSETIDTSSGDGLTASKITWLNPDASGRLTAAEIRLRDQWEARLSTLRSRRDQLDVQAYEEALEAVLLPLSRLYHGTKGVVTDE